MRSRLRRLPDGGAPRTGMGWMHRGHDWQQRGAMMQRPRTFALVYPQEDRKLTPPDVQKIAEAFLLWRRQPHLEGGRGGTDR